MKLRTKLFAHPILTAALVLAFVGVAAAAVPAFQATETPVFCTSCHEMTPYYTAWSIGAHKGVSCVDCHVDGGTVNHFTHKITAAKELVDHLTTRPAFPQSDVQVPDSRCLACHPGIMQSTGPKFSHKAHAGAGACVTCHATVGHDVTIAALAKANVLKAGIEPTTSGLVESAFASTAASASEPATHAPVSCSQCHDLATVPCSTCHQAPHADRGECSTCHQPGPAWVFTHPVSTDCASCHTAPAKHFGTECASCHSPDVPFAKTVYAHTSSDCASCHTAPSSHSASSNKTGACATCHEKPGVSWAFSHPSSSACSGCHSAPSGHNHVLGCAACHAKPGVSWAFSHPSSRSCGSCHSAPAKHYGSSCATCHTKPGVTFAGAVYRHTSSSCSSCHTPPSGHPRTVSCATCHKKPGVSWAASHPASSACASCHTPPANHFGSACASCHKPLTPWTSATFNHPATHHSYLSRPCVSCHPGNVYTKAYCTCHGGKPPSD